MIKPTLSRAYNCSKCVKTIEKDIVKSKAIKVLNHSLKTKIMQQNNDSKQYKI